MRGWRKNTGPQLSNLISNAISPIGTEAAINDNNATAKSKQRVSSNRRCGGACTMMCSK
jgi:hypothetical protein